MDTIRNTVWNLRSKGCTHIEARTEGGKWFYFCVMCRLGLKFQKEVTEHLKSEIHSKMVDFTESTLLRPNPWPFNDGCGLFHEKPSDLIIKDVLCHGQRTDLRAEFVGTGRISVRSSLGHEGNMLKISCQWLGKVEERVEGRVHDFDIVVFPWDFRLGTDMCFRNFIGASKSIKKWDLKRALEKAVSDSTCEVCTLNIYPGKDVATLYSKENRSFACVYDGRNRGPSKNFQVFHVSCLVRWVMLWENKTLGTEGDSVFCPQCEGTGSIYKVNRLAARQRDAYWRKHEEGLGEWINHPEAEEWSSLGLCFPEPQNFDGNVPVPKLLKFYRAQA